MAREYNGHRSWNQWNVCLYLANEEGLYFTAVDCAKRARNLEHLTTLFIRETGLLGDKTPDGATYNRLSIKRGLDSLELTYGKA